MATGKIADWMRNSIGFGTEPFIFCALFTLGAHLSTCPQLLLKKLCFNTYNSTVCDDLDSGHWLEEENIVNQIAAPWNTYFFLAFSVPSIFTCAIIGYFYDRVLKASALVIVPVILLLQSVIYLISAKRLDLHVGFLILGSGINSFCGDIQGIIMLGYAYMADITNKDERRSLRMAITESSVFLGQATGNLFSGYLLETFGFSSVFCATLVVGVINFIYVAMVLPSPVYANVLEEKTEDTSVCKEIKTFLGSTFHGSQLRIFVPLLMAVAFTNMAILGENNMIVLFLKHYPLSMAAGEIGLYLGILHIGRGIGAAINAFVLTKIFKSADYIIAMTGLVSLMCTHFAVSLIRTKEALYITSCLSLTTPLAMSSFRSIATKTVSEQFHGMALSLIAVISMVGLTVATVSTNQMYEYTSKTFPGMAILLLACFSAAALIIVILMYMKQKLQQHLQNEIDKEQSKQSDCLETTPFLEGMKDPGP